MAAGAANPQGRAAENIGSRNTVTTRHQFVTQLQRVRHRTSANPS